MLRRLWLELKPKVNIRATLISIGIISDSQLTVYDNFPDSDGMYVHVRKASPPKP
jgi:hypothetical protein